jgi:asparagine synthase (glutamine-hydrolysing)
MAESLRSRGPDGVGLFREKGLGLVNTRLSIVDLAGGDQPIGNEDGSCWVVQNGEIYNHQELGEELRALGHVFGTHCDTEVLVHGYEEWGARGLLERLNGAFAFALVDRREKRLLVARDRLGIRPLFLHQQKDRLLFASEAKAFFQDPCFSGRVDPRGLAEAFTLWACGPERSFYQGVRELRPGHLLWLPLEGGGSGEVREEAWWDFCFEEQNAYASVEEAAEHLRELLEDSCRLRLRADVPVGAYLSGGLDSSATAALIQKMGVPELRSFAVSFADPLFDESAFQRRMAKELGTKLETVRIEGGEIAEVFPEVVRRCEKPLLRTSPAPLFLLSRAVRDAGMKVVLTGEGADEVFAGYNIFKEMKVRRFWARGPESECRPLLLRKLYPYLARDLGRAEAFTRAFFRRGMEELEDPLYSHRLRFGNTARCFRMLAPEIRDSHSQEAILGDLEAGLPERYQEESPLGRAQDLEIRTFLQGYLLHSQGDRMLMAHSVEGRFPFLDHRLLEFAARLPDSYRLSGLREKWVLRRAVADLLPEEIGKREKRPYRAPILASFFGRGAPDWPMELLSEESLADSGLLDPVPVRRLLQKCRKNLESGVSESDEMALVGVLSTLLLQNEGYDVPKCDPKQSVEREVLIREGRAEVRGRRQGAGDAS